MARGPKLAVIGIDHDHIFGMLGNMLAAGATIERWWSADSATARRFAESLRGAGAGR